MHEQVCYQKSFLTEVIVKIDFASPITALEKSVPNKLTNLFVTNFPIVEPTDVIMQEVAMDGGSIRHSQTATKQWNYFGKDRGKHLSISPQNIFIQYLKYNNYEEMKEHFGSAVDAITKAFPETKAARFGLRYVNQIELELNDPTVWDEYIDASLISGRNFFVGGESITRQIVISELKYGDLQIRVQSGMPNPDYPAQVKRPLFVLDFDASISQAHDLTEALAYMDEGHSRIQALFERSITPNLRSKMNAKPIQ